MFPEVERVVYGKNPIDNVICQLKFPAIMKIDTEVPAEFQDRIRSSYPALSESLGVVIESTPEVKAEGLDEPISKMLSKQGLKTYQFSSEDGQWKISLARNFMSLSTEDYGNWGEFRGRLLSPLEHLVGIYGIPHFQRIGLRYVNVIIRSKLDLEGASWKELINDYMLGLMSFDNMEKNIKGAEGTYLIKMDDAEENIIRLKTQLVRKVDSEEQCYMLDIDFFTLTRVSAEDAIEKLNYLHKYASRLFRWCIKDKLHKAMEPQAA